MENMLTNLLLQTIIETPQNVFPPQKTNKRRKILIKFILKYGAINRNIIKNVNYIETVQLYDDDTFRSHFRMTKSCFDYLLLEVDSNISQSIRRPRIDTKPSLLMTLWTLGNLSSYRDIADRFGVSKGCAVNTVLFICKILTKLSKKYIKWPSTDEMKIVIEKFNLLRGNNSFPNVIGCVDGSHIAIPAPAVDPASYYNRKGFHSILLQGICDSEYKFINVFFGWPGRSHDASVWSSSSICNQLENGMLELPYDCHLLGDSAYPLRNFLMKPHIDNGVLTLKQKKFNKKLSSTRTVIEQAFGRLKSKFRRLKFLNISKITNAKYFVIAAILLHNLILEKDGIDEFEVSSENCDEIDTDTQSYANPNTPNFDNNEGKMKRNYYTETL